MRKKLTIVSDTAIYHNNGKNFAFGPVVREIEYIENNFDQITWIGFNRLDLKGDLIMQEVVNKNIKVVLLRKVGGKGFISMIKILMNYPVMFFTILKHIVKSNIIHTRAPSHPALIAVLISFLFKKKNWWNKFAGNWSQVHPPASYGFQKFLLIKAKFSKVTINGFWTDQPKHCISFENPCLYDIDIINGKKIAENKIFKPPYIFAFVGRLETEKGVDTIIEALKTIPQDYIKAVHFIGDGSKTNFYKKECSFLTDKVSFMGFVSKDEVHKILSKAHFFLLPSTAEGFPKVIAEAACYGTIPIVSNVSSIPHYINHSNGYVWDINDSSTYSSILLNALRSTERDLQKMKTNLLIFAEKFTFANYNRKLRNKIL